MHTGALQEITTVLQSQSGRSVTEAIPHITLLTTQIFLYLYSLAAVPLFECSPESKAHEACICSALESLKHLL